MTGPGRSLINGVICLLFVVFTAGCTKGEAEEGAVDPLQWVDPIIGTGGHGHTFPGAVVPFGMVQLSPDNPSKGWDWTSGYHYSDDTLLGFSHTHLSGTGVGDLLDILVTPYRGELSERERTKKGWIYTKYSHDDEVASAGYYAVDLPDEKVKAELTATKRVGVHRYTFAGNEAAKLFFNLDYAQNYDETVVSFLKVESSTRIVGYRVSTGWAKYQPIYFVAEFDRPFEHQLFVRQESDWKKGPADGDHVHGKFVEASLDFGSLEGKPLTVRVALSYTGIEGARKNLAEETPVPDFDLVREEAENAWREELSKVNVKGGAEDQKKTFYTALYHTFLAPHVFGDVDGRFLGGDGAAHEAKDYNRYTLFSLWDTFRAQHPLLTILAPERVDDMTHSMMGFYKETGLLPSWEFIANETDVMIGYHATPVLVDAYLKGLTSVDGEEILEAAITSATQNSFGIDHYREYGYVPSELEVESVSKTLEYAFDDWAISVLAEKLSKNAIAKEYRERALAYRHLYDETTGFMRGKKADGEWVTPFEPARVEHRTNDYTEANAWQYTWFVPHNVEDLVSLMGGEESFVAKLDELFETAQQMEGDEISADISGLIGQYVHGNEPCHHIPYLYALAGEPEKGVERIRQIMNTMYKATPGGLPGNDDVGQMSAWYVMSAMGFYPVNPVGGDYILGAPLFDEMSVEVGSGKTLNIKRIGPANGKPKEVRINGRPLDGVVVTHDEIKKGGALEFYFE